MYQICVSGASHGESVEESKKLAGVIGKYLAEHGHALLTGATVGLPNFAAEAYKKAGGKMSLGISPASSKVEHVMKYRLPTKAYDAILYSGLHYVGRDMLLITSADAVISVGGRLGTLHEFTIAMESDTPIGIIHGSGGISDEVKYLLEAAKPLKNNGQVVMGTEAEEIMSKLTIILDKINKKYQGIFT